MVAVWIVVMGLTLVWCGACVVAGFAPAGSLQDFRPDSEPILRAFHQSADDVRTAYRAAVGRTPGMRVADEGDGVLLLDSRPTSRILGGNFGMVMSVGFAPAGSGTTVVVQARNKVPWSFTNHDAALRHAEMALRMNAKAGGLVEVV
jgi:hypothetical protein